MAGVFQSTLPARGATDADVLFLCNVEFQSTLPARGATRVTKAECLDLPISIHAPRTGSDRPCGQMRGRRVRDFNPRSPHGERRATDAYRSAFWTFQSTLPARGATPSSAFSMPQSGISIHAPRTGSDLCALAVIVRLVISIHAPRTGSDRTRCSSPTTRRYFNPRSPHGERPCRGYKARHEQTISIHAPRTGSDVVATNCNQVAMHFNPRSPHGERPAQRTWTSAWRDFNPRSPHGERRARRKRRSWSSPISIHAPRTGSDPCTKGGGADPAHFNPRSPHGERLDSTAPARR